MSIIFKEITITDIIEKTSKKVVFASQRNLITSDSNGKGKSTIMKALYHSLGANSAFDDNINKKAMIFDVSISFNDIIYRVVRYIDQYLVFKDGRLEMTCRYGNIAELSEYYKKEFGMYVYLKDRAGGLPIAPPAYSFIPYYLDQDCSWKKEQMPFDSLGQYEKLSKNDLYYYHLSIFNDLYNEIKSKSKEQEILCKNLEEEIAQTQNVYMQLKEQIGSTSICINEQEIEVLISHMSRKINDIFVLFNKVKNELFVLENEKAECDCQILNINERLRIIEKDLSKPKTTAKCPQCGAEFELEIEKEVRDLYNKTFLINRREFYVSRISEIVKEVSLKKLDLEHYTKELNSLESQLKEEKAEYDTYTRRKVADVLFNDLLQKTGELTNKLRSETALLNEYNDKLKQFEVKTENIKIAFRNIYIGNLIQLNVKKFNAERIKPFNKLAIGGSQYVRSTLAFFYTFIELKKQFNKGKFECPLIIDSPREGEQDDMNSKSILEFIFGKYDGEGQLIVASVNGDKYLRDLEDFEEINVIRLINEDNQVMTIEGYQENLISINEVKSYLGLR